MNRAIWGFWALFWLVYWSSKSTIMPTLHNYQVKSVKFTSKSIANQYMALFSRFHKSGKLVLCNFLWISKKTTLSLMLENHCGNVARWLKSRNGHLMTSDPLRFDPQKVLFYLVKWQKCYFDRSYLRLFWVPGACLMARTAQYTPGDHL